MDFAKKERQQLLMKIKAIRQRENIGKPLNMTNCH
jgi:hypothetical protein